MENLIKETLEKLKQYERNQIEPTNYCKNRLKERNINEELLFSTILAGKDLYYVEEQEKPFKGGIEKRHKLVFKISSKYSLIIILAYYPKVLKVVNAIKTSKGAEKAWRNKVLK